MAGFGASSVLTDESRLPSSGYMACVFWDHVSSCPESFPTTISRPCAVWPSGWRCAVSVITLSALGVTMEGLVPSAERFLWAPESTPGFPQVEAQRPAVSPT